MVPRVVVLYRFDYICFSYNSAVCLDDSSDISDNINWLITISKHITYMKYIIGSTLELSQFDHNKRMITL